jgi:hypothetical protein
MQSGAADGTTVPALRGETERLRQLVDALILLARADERGLRPRREEVDLDEVAESERGRPAGGAVVAEVRAEHVRVVGDRGQLARVVRNLVDNARRHARSRVLVVVRREGDEAVVEVSDDGPGVPPADRARVFERFVRLDDARARTDGGSGLGLAIVAEVVAAHGGRVEVTDAPGGGALFRVRLPAAAAPTPPEPGPDAERDVSSAGAPADEGEGRRASQRPDIPTTLPTPRPAPAPRRAGGQGPVTGPGAVQPRPGEPVAPARGQRPRTEPAPSPAPAPPREARRDPETRPFPVVPKSEPQPTRPNGHRPVATPRPQGG